MRCHDFKNMTELVRKKGVYRPAQATPGLLQTNKNQTNIAENNIKFDNYFTQEATVLHTHWFLFYCAYWFLFYYPHMLREIVVSHMHDFHPEIRMSIQKFSLNHG